MDLKPELTEFKNTIANRVTYWGRKVSPSIMNMIVIELREMGGGVIAPYWLGILEHGRKPRRSNVDHHLVDKIYAWMLKHNRFTSKTPKGKANEAKRLTWFINKYGNQQSRLGVYVDIYTSARNQCVTNVMKKYSLEIARINKDIL